jgi:hypothetical protein
MENRGCASWALFSGRQFLFKSVDGTDLNESATLLDKILESISHSEAVYTLKFFEDKIKIKENSPCDGSFNFRLIGEDERSGRAIAYSTNSRAVMDELQKINLRLTEIENEEDEEEDAGVIGLIKDPQIKDFLINTIKGFLLKPVPAPPTKLAGVTNRWQMALSTLQSKGVTIDHFEKLAAMDQTKIAMLINMM